MKCHSKVCLRPRTHRVHWPSGPIECCASCTARWTKVAEAMGLVLHTERLDHARLTEALLED